MVAIFFIIGITGIIMFIIGGYWIIQKLRCKVIIQASAIEKEISFNIEKEGVYCLGILGCGNIENIYSLNASILNVASNTEEKIEYYKIMPRFSKNMNIGVELGNFIISKKGNYKLKLQNMESIVAKDSMVKFIQLIQSKKELKSLTVLIKESYSINKTIIGIIFMVLGANIGTWGIVLAFNYEVFFK